MVGASGDADLLLRKEAKRWRFLYPDRWVSTAELVEVSVVGGGVGGRAIKGPGTGGELSCHMIMTFRLSTLATRRSVSTARWFSTTRRAFTPYHDLLGVAVNENPFRVDPQQLKIAYIKAQRLAHPDAQAGRDKVRASYFFCGTFIVDTDAERQGSQDTAAASSAQLTEAYNTLLHPEKRALYLLSLRGLEIGEHDALGEGGADEELLGTVMEEQFAVEDAETLDEVVSLRDKNEGALFSFYAAVRYQLTRAYRAYQGRGTVTGRRV